MTKQYENLAANALTAGILALALLYFARSIFVPLAFSLFVITLVWPIQDALQRRVSKHIALLVTVGVTFLVIIATGMSVIWAFGKLAQWLFLNVNHFQTIYSDWLHWLEKHGIAIAGPISERFNIDWLISFVQSIAARLNSFIGFAVLTAILAMLGLLEVDDFKSRLRLPSVQPYGKAILRANREIGAKLRRFMLVRSFASALTGFAVWLFVLFAGLELAAAWGLIAFALNYIPVLGPLLATVLPALFAFVQFDSWQMAALIFMSLNIIQFFVGSYLEPRLAGASLLISPFVVIFAVFFWSVMWGVLGAFIGVPILIVLIVYLKQAPSTRWLAVILSRGTVDNVDTPPHQAPR